MQRRISFIEPGAEEPQPQPDAPPVAALDQTADVDALIRAGVVTHQIKSAEHLDAMFAVSQIHDLPEVHFVAAFKEGSIFLGCPGDLPESLSEMMEPVAQPAPAPDLTAKLDTLLAGLGQVQDRTEAQFETGLARMDNISHRLEFVSDALHQRSQETPVHPDYAPDFAAMKQTLKTLEKAIGTAAAPDITAPMERITSHLSAFSQDGAAQAAQTHAALDQIVAQLAKMHEKVGHLAAAPRKDDAPMKEAVADLSAHLVALQGSHAKIEKDLVTARTQEKKRDTTLTALTKSLSAVGDRLDEGTKTKDLVQLQKDVAVIKTAVVTPSPEGAQTAQKLDAIEAELTKLTKAASKPAISSRDRTMLKKAISDLSKLSEGVAELRETAQVMMDGDQDDPLLRSIANTMETLRKEISTGEDADLVALKESLSNLPDQVASTTDDKVSKGIQNTLSQLQQEIKRLANQPKPVLDLTEQRRSFATFTTVISAIAQRLEAAAEQISANATQDADTEPSLVAIQGLEGRLEDLQNALGDTNAPVEDIGRRVDAVTETVRAETSTLKDMQASILDALSHAPSSDAGLEAVSGALESVMIKTADLAEGLDDLRRDMRAVATQPPAPLDLTAQRESFARFGVAMGTVVQRLEDTIAALQSQDPAEATNPAEIKAVMQALPMLLQQALDEVLDNNPIQNAVTQLRDEMTTVTTQMQELEKLRTNVQAVARHPDPVLDLSEQRQSFARFGTAIGMVVARLEQVSNQLDTHEAVDLTPFLQGLEELKTEIGAITSTQADQATTLEDRLEALSKQLAETAATNRTSQTGTFKETSSAKMQVSLEEMRFLFAELVAQQIRNNAIEDAQNTSHSK